MEKNSNSTKINSLETLAVSSSILEKLLMLSARRIRQLTEENILVRISKGKYDLTASVQNYIKYLKVSNDINKNTALEFSEYEIEKAKNEKIKRMQNELKLSVMQGQHFKSSQVEQVMTDILTAFRSKISGIPTKVAPMLIDRQDAGSIQVILQREILEALNELKAFNPVDFYDRDYIEFSDDVDYNEEDNTQN